MNGNNNDKVMKDEQKPENNQGQKNNKPDNGGKKPIE